MDEPWKDYAKKQNKTQEQLEETIISLLPLGVVRISFLRPQAQGCTFYSTILITGHFVFSVEIYLERH